MARTAPRLAPAITHELPPQRGTRPHGGRRAGRRRQPPDGRDVGRADPPPPPDPPRPPRRARRPQEALPAGGRGPRRPAAPRVRPRHGRPHRPPPVRRPPVRPGDPHPPRRPRGGRVRAGRRRPPRPVRRAPRRCPHRRPPAQEWARRSGQGGPRHRRPPAGRRARGPVGHPGRPQRRGAPGEEPPVGPAGRPGGVARGGPGRGAGAGAGVASDGRHPIRWSVAHALPGVPYPPCQFHDLREAARPILEAARNAKKLLRKRVRRARPIERSVEGRPGPAAEVAWGYCGAVRRALTDDGRPPLAAPGLRLYDRLAAIRGRIGRAGAKGGSRPSGAGSRGSSAGRWRRRPPCGSRSGWRTGGSIRRSTSSGPGG